jgi:hypothetical protein
LYNINELHVDRESFIAAVHPTTTHSHTYNPIAAPSQTFSGSVPTFLPFVDVVLKGIM